MEAALKEVFNVHRNVVRGLRSQLQQALQEKDDPRRCVERNNKQLEEEVRKLRGETSNLFKLVVKHRCSEGLSVSSQDSQNKALYLLGKQLRVVEHLLSVISKEQKQTSPTKKSKHVHSPNSDEVDENQLPEAKGKEDDSRVLQRECRRRQKETRQAAHTEEQEKNRQTLNEDEESCPLSRHADNRPRREGQPNEAECKLKASDHQRTERQACKGSQYHRSPGDSPRSSEHDTHLVRVPLHKHHGISPTGDEGDMHLSKEPFSRQQGNSPENSDGNSLFSKAYLQLHEGRSHANDESNAHYMEEDTGDAGADSVLNTEDKSPPAGRGNRGAKSAESGPGTKLQLSRFSGKRKRYTEGLWFQCGVEKKRLKSASGGQPSCCVEEGEDDGTAHSPQSAPRPASRPSFLAPHCPATVPSTSPNASSLDPHCLVPDTCSTSFTDHASPLRQATPAPDPDRTSPLRRSVSVKTQRMLHNSSTVMFVPETLVVDVSSNDREAEEDCGDVENVTQEGATEGDTCMKANADVLKEAGAEDITSVVKLKDAAVIGSARAGKTRTVTVIANASVDAAEDVDELEPILSPLSTSTSVSQRTLNARISSARGEKENVSQRIDLSIEQTRQMYAKVKGSRRSSKRPQLRSKSGGSSQDALGTDSIVFGRTSLLGKDASLPESTAPSLCLLADDEEASSSLQSPVFTAHHKEAVWGEHSPALFDEEACISGQSDGEFSAPSQGKSEQFADVTLAPPSTSHFTTPPSSCISKPPASHIVTPPTSHITTSTISHVETPPSASLLTAVSSAAHVITTSRPEGRTPSESPTSPLLLKSAVGESRKQVLHTAYFNAHTHFPRQPSPSGVRPTGNAGHLSPIIVSVQREQNTAVLKPVLQRNLFDSKPLGSKTLSSDNNVNSVLGGDDQREIPAPVQSSQLNASLDPGMRLTQYLQTLPEEEVDVMQGEEDEADMTVDPGSLASGLGSELHSGGSPPSSDHLRHAGHTPPAALTAYSPLEDSFDRVPEKKKQAGFAYTEVVRKQDERRKLQGFSCHECKQYYSAAGLSEAELASRMAECSRHRAQQARPSTPEHFWSVGFPDSQECDETSYSCNWTVY